MTRILPAVLAALTALATPFSARADADAEWKAVLAMDAGPQQMPANRDEARRIAKAYLAQQSAALNAFTEAHPSDPRVLDAKLRLISIRATLGSIDKKPLEVRGALKDLMALERSPDVPRSRLPDISFRRISMQMQTLDGTDSQIREAVLVAAQNFAAKFPSDKRAPRLLVEAATQFDEDPATMKKLLNSARSLSREPALNARIDDDLRRLNALNNPVNVRFDTIQGGKVDLSRLRGKIVVMVFWAAESPHSLLWMQKFTDAIKPFAGKIELIGVSLDENRSSLDEAMKTFDIRWPTYFDGKGWESGVARPLGINAIPTVWMIDKRGVLRALNARENYAAWIRKLILER